MASRVEQAENSQTQSRLDRLGHIDKKWPEVMFINDYAVFIGYLSMAVTGTGFLVLTWSTVVLLGGFVTMLAKKDFWCLTVITLVQTRVFDVFLNGNISYFGYSFKRLWEAALSIALPQDPYRKGSARGLIRVLVFTIVLCPLFALYMFGLFVSPGISLWRLLQQDYGDMAGDSSKANLKPALVVLYSLALFQGVLFYYRAISSLEEQRLLKLVAQGYGLAKDDKARGSISDYLREIRVGCEKDPSFASGRNLITYAASLMLSNSPDSYLSGARIIDTLIIYFSSVTDQSAVESQCMLMNNMIGSASSSAIKKFVQMLDSKGQSDSNKEIRSRAMRIVAHFASEIRLNKIPYGIQCISSFLDNPEPEVSHEHKETSIYILRELIDDEENLRLMSNTNGLALKIIKMLVDSEGTKLHHSDHDKWCSKIAVPGMDVIKGFTSAVKRSNNMQLTCEILESTSAANTLQGMLECQRCKVEEELQKSVIMVLTQVTSMGTSLPMGDEVKKGFINSLINIFLDSSDHKSSMKKLAGESLEQLSCMKENSGTILGAKDGRIVDSLTEVILDVDSKYRKSAADILKHLCSHYTTNEESRFQKLRKAMIDDVILEVLREILGCRPTAESRPPSPLPPWYWYAAGYGHYNVEELEALSSLCATVHVKLISQDPDLATRFDQKAEEIRQDMKMEEVMTFADLVKKAKNVVDNTRQFNVVDNTRRFNYHALHHPQPQYVHSAEEDSICCIS